MFKDKKGNCQIMATKGIWPLKLEANVVENKVSRGFLSKHGYSWSRRRMNNEKEKQPYLSQGWLAQLQGWWGLESRKRWKWTERTNEECVDKSAICWQKIFWLQSLPLPRSIRTKSTILIVKFNCFAWLSWRAPKSIVASFKEIYQLMSYWLGTEKYHHRKKRERKKRRKGKRNDLKPRESMKLQEEDQHWLWYSSQTSCRKSVIIFWAGPKYHLHRFCSQNAFT